MNKASECGYHKLTDKNNNGLTELFKSFIESKFKDHDNQDYENWNDNLIFRVIYDLE